MTKSKGLIRHIAIVLAIMTALFFLSSCGGPSPTETTDTFLKAIKEQDVETLKSVYAGGEVDLLDSVGEDAEETEDEAFSKILDEQLLPKILDFDYELSNEQIDGDKASVDVKINAYRIGDIFTSFLSDYMTQALMLAFSDASEEELDALADTLLRGKIADATEKSFEMTVTLNLSKVDGKWMVNEITDQDDILDALTGGLFTSLQSMEDTFSAWEDE